MALLDYLRGPKHKAEADLLRLELVALQTRYTTLEEVARELSVLDLIAIKTKIQGEETRCVTLQASIALEEENLQRRQFQLRVLEEKILVSADTIELENFALYEPKYQLKNSIEYKNRLGVLREEQKATARSLSAQVDTWGNFSLDLTDAKWKKLRKDLLKPALRAFNSESEYCIDKVKFSNVEKMEARIQRAFAACNKLLDVAGISWKEIVLERKLQELHLAHEYQVKRQEEKEAAQQARADQREAKSCKKRLRKQGPRSRRSASTSPLLCKSFSCGSPLPVSDKNVRVYKSASMSFRIKTASSIKTRNS